MCFVPQKLKRDHLAQITLFCFMHQNREFINSRKRIFFCFPFRSGLVNENLHLTLFDVVLQNFTLLDSENFTLLHLRYILYARKPNPPVVLYMEATQDVFSEKLQMFVMSTIHFSTILV